VGGAKINRIIGPAWVLLENTESKDNKQQTIESRHQTEKWGQVGLMRMRDASLKWTEIKEDNEGENIGDNSSGAGVSKNILST
jgi:hypothetical protein